jgi:uncharacterized protein (TIGR02145 family)
MKNLIKLIGLGLLVLSGILHSCEKEVPTVTTSEVTNITATSATCGGTIIDEGTGRFRVRGICWSKGITPTIADDIISAAGPTVTFTYNMSDLDAGTTYYVRAYATNNAGTGYGMAMPFTTLLLDVEGNTYKTVTIGTQDWMAENLKTTKYRNGDLIGTTTPAGFDIYNEITPKYQWAYAGSENYVATYGRLYTWYAVTDSRNVCPTGWHVPTASEWTVLVTFVGGWETAGGKLKETGTAHWQSPNTGATNETGFTALPSGRRDYANDFDDLGSDGYWWSSTSSSTEGSGVGRTINYYVSSIYVDEVSSRKHSGYSVRCVKD